VRSMTGYGTGEARTGSGRVLVEARVVNHRFLDVRVRMPRELGDHSVLVEEIVRKRLDRGRVDINVRTEGDPAGRPELDVPRARAAFEALCALRDEVRPGEPVPLSLLSCVPDLFAATGGGAVDELRAALEQAAIAACEAIERMRSTEGTALARDFRERSAQMRLALETLRARSPDIVDAYRRRLHERIEQLLRGGDVTLDPARLEHEVVLFADRVDVTEEITRLASHIDQIDALCGGGGNDSGGGGSGAVGRRLDFLLQEVAREVNTLGAKSPDAEVTRMVVELKTELERMREQAQNVL